ncbi:MAG TPA: tetratricopeptide repeat protein, partial [Burkholderiaceae bacterium]
NALYQREDYIGAVQAFEQAVSEAKGNPQDYLGWANLADTLLWIPGRTDDARKAYKRAIELLEPRLQRAPNDVMLVSRMGLYAARIGDKGKSALLTKNALAIAPKDPDVHFRSGLAYELNGQRDDALAALIRARELGYPQHLIDTNAELVDLRRDARYSQHQPQGK